MSTDIGSSPFRWCLSFAAFPWCDYSWLDSKLMHCDSQSHTRNDLTTRSPWKDYLEIRYCSHTEDNQLLQTLSHESRPYRMLTSHSLGPKSMTRWNLVTNTRTFATVDKFVKRPSERLWGPFLWGIEF